jgi:hypothetical protein
MTVKQQYMRQLAFNVYVKRGGLFKEYLGYLRTVPLLDFGEIKEWFSNKYTQLIAVHGVEYVKWQTKCGRSDPSMMSIHSDAEGFRLSWWVEHGPTILYPDRAAFQAELDRHFQETRGRILAKELLSATVETVATVSAVVKFEGQLEQEVGVVSRNAATLYRKIDDSEWRQIVPQMKCEVINYEALLYIADKVGYTGVDHIVRQVPKILIEEWRDPVKGEEKALTAVFRSGGND